MDCTTQVGDEGQFQVLGRVAGREGYLVEVASRGERLLTYWLPVAPVSEGNRCDRGGTTPRGDAAFVSPPKARRLLDRIPSAPPLLQSPRGVDYDLEAERLWASRGRGHRCNAMDCLWKEPDAAGGGMVFVGSETAACSWDDLVQRRITHIVNCTHNIPEYFDHCDAFEYFRFNIGRHSRCIDSDADVNRFVEPMLEFVEIALRRPGNVLLHCKAGAHRAGTAGIICLMHLGSMRMTDAIALARAKRPVIEPDADFLDLLSRVERAWPWLRP